jgi:hypothetical protein
VKKRKVGYLKGKITYLKTNNKNKSIRHWHRGTSKFKNGYQYKSNSLMDEKGNLLAHSQRILSR